MTLSSSDILETRDDCVRLRVDTNLYGEGAVFRACYLFTDRCYLFLERLDSEHVVVQFKKRTEEVILDTIVGDFANELIDQRIRKDIEEETGAIRELIVTQAFAEADLDPETDRTHSR